MALEVEQGSFTRQAGTGNQTISLADTGLVGKVVLLWGNILTTEGFADNYTFGKGYAASATKQRSMCFGGTANTGGGRVRVDDAAYTILQNVGATISAQADFVSFSAGEFVLDWTTNDGALSVINYLILGGADISNVDIDHYSTNTSTGTQTVSGLDMGATTPKIGFFFGSKGIDTIDTAATDTSACFGWAESSTQRGYFAELVDSNNGMDGGGRDLSDDQLLFQFGNNNASIDSEMDFDSFGSDQFVIDITDAPMNAYIVCYCVISGDLLVDVGLATGRASTSGTVVTTGVGFQPEAMVFGSSGLTLDQPASDQEAVFGAADGTNESCTWYGMADDQGTDNEDARDNFDADKSIFIAEPNPAGGGTLRATASLQSFDSDGFTMDWQYPGAVLAYRHIWAAFASASTGASGTSAMTMLIPTMVAAGKLTYNATSAMTMLLPTMAASGKLGHFGTSAMTIPVPTMAATGVASHLGTSAMTMLLPTMAATGAAAHQGTSAMTMLIPTMAATGVLNAIIATSAMTMLLPTMTAAGKLGHFGTSAMTMLLPTMAATGVASHLGTSAMTMLLPTMTASGKLGHFGASAMTMLLPTMVAAGVAAHHGVSAMTMLIPTMAATGVAGAGAVIVCTSGVWSVPISFAACDDFRITIDGPAADQVKVAATMELQE